MLPVRDSSSTFGSVSRWNHAIAGLIALVLLAIGLYFHEMPKGDERKFWLGLHVSIGTLAALPLLFRVGWRLREGRPEDLPQDRRMQLLARFVHGVLLLALAVLALTGPLIPWTVERPLSIFGVVSVPSPLPRMHDLHEALEVVHKVASRALLFGVIAHVAGIVKYASKAPAVLVQRMGWKNPA